MSNLNNLTSKIIKDCEDEATQILKEADDKASEIIKEKVSITQKEVMQILQEAEAESHKLAEQIRAGKKLEIRDSSLNAKQAVIDKVFVQALLELNQMTREDYNEFLKNSLLGMDFDDEELLIPSKYEISNLESLNAFLKEKGKKGTLKLYDGARTIPGGFVLMKNGIESNYTFEALIDYYRYELEHVIIGTLF